MHTAHCTPSIRWLSSGKYSTIALGFHSWKRSEKGDCRIAIQLFPIKFTYVKCSNDLVNCPRMHSSFSHLHLIARFHKNNNNNYNFIQQQSQNKSNKFTIRIESNQFKQSSFNGTKANNHKIIIILLVNAPWQWHHQ